MAQDLRYTDTEEGDMIRDVEVASSPQASDNNGTEVGDIPIEMMGR